ncbi:MAG: YfhO family protein, partial [Anaerolineae bacterium]
DAWKPAGGGDLVSFLFPTYRFAAAQLSQGELPLWNPHLYGGAPFLADMQSGLFYPLNLLLFFLAPIFRYEALEWMAVLHVFLAGAFMYLCLRYLEPGRPLRMPAAFAGAVAYMFSDMFVVHFGNLNLIAVAAWLPLIFLLFWRALRSRSLGLVIAAGLVLGISTLEGHLQITLMIGLALGLSALVASWSLYKQRPGLRHARHWNWPLLALMVTAAVAMGLSALVLLPAIEYARLSPRAVLPYREAARYSLVPALLGELWVPGLFSSREPLLYWGVWDRVAAGYLGVFSLLLAGLAVLLHRGRRLGLLLVLGLAGLLLALGGASIFHGWAYLLLPGFDQLRAPARFVLILDFALAALAALGLDRLLSPLDRQSRRSFESAWRALLWFGAGAAIVGGAWAYLVVYQAQDRDPTLFWRVSAASSSVIFALAMFGSALAWLAARRSGRLSRPALGWLAAGLIFVDLASVGAYADLGHHPPTEGYDHPQVVEFLKNEPGFFRIDSRTNINDVWQPDLALLAGLYDVGGVDNPLVVADVDRYWQATGGRSAALYDFLGARYVLGSKEVELDWDKFSLAFEGDPEVNVYRNETALPRAFVVPEAIFAGDHEEAWEMVHRAGFDPGVSVVLEGGQPLTPQTAGQAAGTPVVRVSRYEPDVLEIQVEAPASGYLVLSDPYYPGWQAKVDGEPVELLRANYAFRAIPIPAGSHTATMAFRPNTWRAGLVLTTLTVLALLAVAGTVLAGRRRRDS